MPDFNRAVNLIVGLSDLTALSCFFVLKENYFNGAKDSA